MLKNTHVGMQAGMHQTSASAKLSEMKERCSLSEAKARGLQASHLPMPTAQETCFIRQSFRQRLKCDQGCHHCTAVEQMKTEAQESLLADLKRQHAEAAEAAEKQLSKASNKAATLDAKIAKLTATLHKVHQQLVPA